MPEAEAEAVQSFEDHVVLRAFGGRVALKYGERGYRFALMEAGHCAQNVLLCSAALGLAATPVGGFLDDEVAATLAIDGIDESPLYLIPVGRAGSPAGPDQLVDVLLGEPG